MTFVLSAHATNNGGSGSVSIWPDDNAPAALVQLQYNGHQWKLGLSNITKADARQVVDQWVRGMFEENKE